MSFKKVQVNLQKNPSLIAFESKKRDPQKKRSQFLRILQNMYFFGQFDSIFLFTRFVFDWSRLFEEIQLYAWEKRRQGFASFSSCNDLLLDYSLGCPAAQ